MLLSPLLYNFREYCSHGLPWIPLKLCHPWNSCVCLDVIYVLTQSLGDSRWLTNAYWVDELTHSVRMDFEGSSQEEGSSAGSLWLVLHFLPIFFCDFCQVALCPRPLGSELAGGTDLSVGTGELGLDWVMTSLPLTWSFRWGDWKPQHPDG